MEFHYFWTFPLLLCLVLWAYFKMKHLKSIWRTGILVHILLALTYTTPWDNFLIARSVWTYPADRVIGVWGYVPYEEYLFFILQTVICALFLYLSWFVTKRSFDGDLYHVEESSSTTNESARFFGGIFCLLITLLSVWGLFYDSSFYISLIFVWASPVFALQWFVGGDCLWRERRTAGSVLLLISSYFWVADAFALNQGIWSISEKYTLGLKILGLPLEEALFFMVTSLLVIQGLTLLHCPKLRSRASLFFLPQKKCAK